MQLEFLNQLNREQIISLINYVTSKKRDSIDPRKIATAINIYNEPDRCDENNNQYIFVEAWKGDFNVGDFRITDFNMKDIMTHEDFSSELREYMFSLFGNTYLQGIKNYHSLLAEKECERLESLLQKGTSL